MAGLRVLTVRHDSSDTPRPDLLLWFESLGPAAEIPALGDSCEHGLNQNLTAVPRRALGRCCVPTLPVCSACTLAPVPSKGLT